MSSIGFPDGQRITQWLGAPIVQATALAIGNVLHTDGPYNLASWASVIVAIKPTGGSVTVTVRQRVSGGPASLELPETFIIPAGSVGFESVVLFGDAVYLDLTGSAPGVTVDYALYPSNTTTNAQVLATATINVQHNEVLVASEGTLDFVDTPGAEWTLTDDAPNTRMKIQRAVVPTAKAYINAGPYVLPTGAITIIPLDATEFNQRAMFAGASPGRLTAPVAGVYEIAGTVWFAASGVGAERIARLRKNGATALDDTRAVPWAGDWNVHHVITHELMAAGDYVELVGFQDTGAGLNILGGLGQTQMSAHLVG